MAKQDDKRKKRKKPTKAERADRHALYQKSVQDPDFDVHMIERFFKRYRKRKPLTVKEDFCGTAYFSVAWCKSNKKRTALGIDLDQPTLDWGIEHNLTPAGEKVTSRIELRNANVLDVRDPKVDAVCALNFSYCIFKTRAELVRYFRTAYESLVDDGIFVIDLFGGTEAVDRHEDPPRKYKGHRYHWEHASYNPIDHHTTCYIHFSFPDGSRLDRAFEYEWRLWTIPEIRECFEEAGFQASKVWWDDGDDESDYLETEEAENQAGWLAYLVALK